MLFSRRKKNSKSEIASVHFNLEKEQEFSMFIRYLSHPVSIAWRNFLAGTFQGLGILFGTALFITVLSFILKSVLGEIPFFSDFSSAMQTWMDSVLHSQQ